MGKENKDNKEKKEKIVKRPTKKSIIIYFALSMFCVYGLYFFATYTTNPDHEGNLYLNDAIYVGDGKVHPENEGKLIAVPGKLENTASAKDELFGIEFDAARVDRHVEKLEYRASSKEWVWTEVYEGQGVNGYESHISTGQFKVGDFKIASDLNIQIPLYSRDAKKSDFTDEQLKSFEDKGFVIESSLSQFYISMVPFSQPLSLKEYEKKHFNGSEAGFKADTADFDDKIRVRWTLGSVDEGVTVIGYQKGDTIELCKDLDANSVKSGKLTKEEYDKQAVPSHERKSTYIMFAVLAVFFLYKAIKKLILYKKMPPTEE